MTRTKELTFGQKRFLVQRLAGFDTPSEAARAFKDEFGFDVARNRVAYYDPTTRAGAALDPMLKAFFEETRKAFLEEIDSIPIAQKAVRLRHLQRQVDYFAERYAAGIVLQLLEAAAKEMGGIFTNQRKHEHTGNGGGRVEIVAVPSDLSDLSDGELLRLYRKVAASPPSVDGGNTSKH